MLTTPDIQPDQDGDSPESLWRYAHIVDFKDLPEQPQQLLYTAITRFSAIRCQQAGEGRLAESGIAVTEGKTRFVGKRRLKTGLRQITVEFGKDVTLHLLSPTHSDPLSIQICVWESTGLAKKVRPLPGETINVKTLTDEIELAGHDGAWVLMKATSWIQAFYKTIMYQ